MRSKNLFIFLYATAVFSNLLFIVRTGFQLSKSLALELSTCKEPNNRFATSFLPINLAIKLNQLPGTRISHKFLSKALETFFINSVLDISSPSEIKNISFAALGCSVFWILKSTKLSNAINERLLYIVPNGSEFF